MLKIRPPEQLESIQAITPTPKDNEVLVDIKAAGVGDSALGLAAAGGLVPLLCA